MTRTTLSDLFAFKIATVRPSLKKKFKPLLEIQEEITIFNDPKYVYFAIEDGSRTCFRREYVEAIKRAFNSVDLYLSQDVENRRTGDRLRVLVGKLPWKHYVILSPNTRQEEKETEK